MPKTLFGLLKLSIFKVVTMENSKHLMFLQETCYKYIVAALQAFLDSVVLLSNLHCPSRFPSINVSFTWILSSHDTTLSITFAFVHIFHLNNYNTEELIWTRTYQNYTYALLKGV